MNMDVDGSILLWDVDMNTLVNELEVEKADQISDNTHRNFHSRSIPSYSRLTILVSQRKLTEPDAAVILNYVKKCRETDKLVSEKSSLLEALRITIQFRVETIMRRLDSYSMPKRN